MALIQAHVRPYGTGERPAHFIHCNLATGRAWEPLAAQMADDLRILAVDMLGQGRSPMPDTTRDYQLQCAEASIAVLEREGQPQDLVGHSFGGCIALRIATLRPDLVRTLVLFEPVFFGFLHDAGLPMFEAILNAERDMHEALEREDMMAAADAFLTRWGMPGEWARMGPEQRQSFADRMWLIGAQHGSIIEDNDWRLRLNDLADLNMPVLVMHGEASPPVMSEMTRVISSVIPNAEADSLAKAGHMLPITHAPECAARLRAFWGI